MNHNRRHRCHRGFTLVELLVVIAIIGVLVALLLPAVQAAREAARRSSCQNNLRQTIIALHNYEFANEHFPVGVTNDTGPVKNVSEGNHINWIARILPELGERARFSRLDFAAGAYADKNKYVADKPIAVLLCASDVVRGAFSNYAGVHHDVEAPIDTDNNGVLFLNSRITFADVKDGSAHTLFVGEKINSRKYDLGWLSGTRATLRNTGVGINAAQAAFGWGGSFDEDDEAGDEGFDEEEQEEYGGEYGGGSYGGAGEYGGGFGDSFEVESDGVDYAKPINPKLPLAVGGFGSYHPGGAQFAKGDGSVTFISDSVSASVLQNSANRADGKIPGDDWW